MEINPLQRKRCKRYNIPGHAHELTFSCYHNQPFLKSPVACKSLAQTIESNRTRHSFKLWAYVFMPDHVHLLIYPTEDNYSISKILQAIKLSVSKKMINYLKNQKTEALKYLQTGRKDKKYTFWQDGGGYDRNIFQKDICRDVIKYIHANPVKRGLVDKPSQWYFSSYNDWEGLATGPVRLDMESFRKL